MSRMKEKYLQEYEKYSHVKITPQRYRLKNNSSIQYDVLEVDEISEKVWLKTTNSGNEKTKTLHWCRKNLAPVEA